MRWLARCGSAGEANRPTSAHRFHWTWPRHLAWLIGFFPCGGCLLVLSGCPSADRTALSERGIEAAQRIDSPDGLPATNLAGSSASIGEAFRDSSKLSSTIQLHDATSQSGIDFVHQDGSTGQFHLMETMTGGLALFDMDGDDFADVFFCSGIPLAVTDSNVSSTARSDPTPAFYQNLGGLQFRDVTQFARLDGLGFGLGVAVGDFDNDGFRDFYLNNFGPNQFWRNNGDGTFSLDASSVEVSQGERFGAGVCFADVEGDGGLDLVVGNYVGFSPADVQQSTRTNRNQYLGPQDFRPETLSLLINELDGTWKDASRASGLAAVAGTAMGMVAGDFNGDMAADIFVANDEMQNFLFLNDGRGNFREAGFLWGVAVDADGKVNGNMGVDCADVDNDGLTDLMVTSFEREMVTLYRGTEHGVFLDVTRSSGLGAGTVPHVTWGCCWGDLDNDGDRDAFIASGHLDERDNNSFYRVANLVYENEWSTKRRMGFRNVSQLCGDVARVLECSRGAAVDDLDNDGDLDVMVLNRGATPTLLRNEVATNHWLQIKLVGRLSNRDAIGAHVKVSSEDGHLQLMEEVRSGRGYQSHWGDRLHFGLGASTPVVDIHITWPDGSQQRVAGVVVDQRLTIIQPKSVL